MAFVREFARLKSASLAAAGPILIAGAFMLSACQSGGPIGALDLGLGGGKSQPAEEGAITAEELAAYCPEVLLAESGAVRSAYQRGGDGDPTRLIYRAAITDTTRSCTYGGGMTSMTIGMAGRFIPGPAGSAGAVRLPLRVTVYQDTTQIHSQQFEHELAVADTIGATQFIVVDRNFSMPNPNARNVRVIVGFVEEPKGR